MFQMLMTRIVKSWVSQIPDRLEVQSGRPQLTATLGGKRVMKGRGRTPALAERFLLAGIRRNW